MENWWERFCALWQEPCGCLAGISLGAGELCLVCLEKGEAGWCVAGKRCIPLPEAVPGPGIFSEAAALAKVALARDGRERSRIALVLPEEHVFCYTKEFPALPLEEMREAARWDLLAILPGGEAEQGSELGFLLLGSDTVPAQGKELLLAALEKEKARSIRNAFDEAGLSLAALTLLPPLSAGRERVEHVSAGQSAQAMQGAEETVFPRVRGAADLAASERPAFMAAAGLLEPAGVIQLLPREARPGKWAFGRIAMALMTLLFICFTLVYGFNFWKIHHLQQEQQQMAQELFLLSGEKKRMAAAEQERQGVETRERLLLSLAHGGIPCRSLLVHLGTRTVEGVWIRDLRVENGREIVLKGVATSYDALANFLKCLEEDKGFFVEKPALTGSERKADREGSLLVYFSVQTKI